MAEHTASGLAAAMPDVPGEIVPRAEHAQNREDRGGGGGSKPPRKSGKGVPFGRVPRVWLLQVSTLIELQVLCLLSSYAEGESWTCFPKKETMAQDLQISERSVQRTVVLLEKKGLIRRMRQGRTSWLYELLP